MRPIRSLLVYFAVVFLGGALLAPCLYWLVRDAATHWPALSHLAASPFHRYLARSLLGLALIGLIPMLAVNDMLDCRAIGLRGEQRPMRRALLGFVVGFVSLACVLIVAFAAHARAPAQNQTLNAILAGVLKAAAAAIVVAVLEEILFRGALFGLLRKSMSWPWALAISSAVYSGVHFIQNVDLPGPIQWNSGVALLGEMFTHGPPLIPMFLTLFVAGACLALAYEWTGTLYFSIGLHAGWIFWLQSCKLLTQPVHGANTAFWGTDKLIDGWLSFCALTAVLAIMSYARSSSGDSGGSKR